MQSTRPHWVTSHAGANTLTEASRARRTRQAQRKTALLILKAAWAQMDPGGSQPGLSGPDWAQGPPDTQLPTLVVPPAEPFHPCSSAWPSPILEALPTLPPGSLLPMCIPTASLGSHHPLWKCCCLRTSLSTAHPQSLPLSLHSRISSQQSE